MYICEICNYSNKSSYNYKNHLNSIKHLNIKKKLNYINSELNELNKPLLDINTNTNTNINTLNQFKEEIEDNTDDEIEDIEKEIEYIEKEIEKGIEKEIEKEIGKDIEKDVEKKNEKEIKKDIKKEKEKDIGVDISKNNKKLNTRVNSIALDINKPYKCYYCNNSYKHQSGLSRHKKICNSNANSNINIDNIRKEYEYKLQIEKLKNELNKKDFQLQINNQNNIINNSNNTIINNNIKISKVQFLNLNFSNVIDINTFIENYQDKYGLSRDDSKILLENYQTDGVNSCISALIYYLKKSAIKQYKEIKGKEIEMNNVILPFILSDKSLREHFEKSINGKWDKTTMIDSIKKIITITNDQIFKYHKQFMPLSAVQKKRVINGILKASAYSLLSQITIPEFYKINIDTEAIDKALKENNTEIDYINLNDEVERDDEYNCDSDDEYN